MKSSMKPVSLQTQKRIVWIPYLNIACLFIWLYNSHVLKYGTRYVFRTIWIMLSSAAPFVFLGLLADNFGEGLQLIADAVNVYFSPLIIGWRLIRLQESLE